MNNKRLKIDSNGLNELFCFGCNSDAQLGLSANDEPNVDEPSANVAMAGKNIAKVRFLEIVVVTQCSQLTFNLQ